MLKNIFILFIICIHSLNAQTADLRLNNMIKQGNWFALEKEFPMLKDSVGTYKRRLAELVLDCRFNGPKKVLMNIDSLLMQHSNEMDLQNRSFCIYQGALAYEALGEYAKSADMLQHFLDAYSTQASQNTLEVFNVKSRELIRFRKEKAPELVRPQRDVELPFKLINNKAVSGKQLIVPVTIHGKVYQFLFDTGCSENTITRRMADEIGVTSLIDSVHVIGMRESFGHEKGILDSLSIGDITLKNSVIFINNTLTDADRYVFSQFDGILGLNFMRAVGEIQLLMQEQRMVFPIRQTELPSFGRNMCWTEFFTVQLEVIVNNEPQAMCFDTGMDASDFSYSYYLKHQAWIDMNCQKHWWTLSGIGGGYAFFAYNLTVSPFKIGSTSIKMIENIPVVCSQSTSRSLNGDGIVGMDMLLDFTKVILNFDRMFADFIHTEN